MLHKSECTLISVGIDWLTATTKSDEAFLDAMDSFKAMDGEPHELEFMGYVGQTKNNVFIGTAYSPQQVRPHIMRVSGENCLEFIKMLGWGYLDDWRASRIDLQATYQLNNARPIADELYTRSDVNATSYYKNGDGAVTVYVNKRSGDAFARVYDKGLESGATDEAGLIWRFEVELKRVMAAMHFSQLHEGNLDTRLVTEKVGAMVWGWFDARDISIPKPSNLEFVKIDIPREESTAEKKLAWLKKQVRKSIHSLCDEVGEQVVAEALGLLKIERPHLPDEE